MRLLWKRKYLTKPNRMKATELRIGNRVMVNHRTDLEATVVNIGEESVEVIFERQPDLVNGLIVHPDKLKPITLTEERLLKRGFKRHDDNVHYSIEIDNEDGFTPSFLTINLSGEYLIGYPCEYNGGKAKVKYVHQLENLYFALTGEELPNELP